MNNHEAQEKKMAILLLVTILILIFNIYATVDIILGTKKMRNLVDIEPLPLHSGPKVSIIVPACNEEDTIEPALRTLLSLEYEPFEIIVINDRSTDRTGEILKEIQQEYPQLKIHEIAELPAGWLGKNHALHQGTLIAEGEYLLFTDADILFEKTTVARAMTLMVREGHDHLALIFRNIARGHLLNAMITDAGGGLFFLFKPWKVSDPKSKNFIGVGAFNLINKNVYMEINGHEEVRMHPIDDIMLGKIIKQKGFRQECLSGYDFLTVHWYETPIKMINGLMKNIFALFNFRVTYVLAAVLLILLGTIFPVWGIYFLPGLPKILCLIIVLTRFISFTYGTRLIGTSLWTIPFSLLTPYLNIYIILKGMLKTIDNDGIDWRGTHYPMNKLKENMPIL